jgi:hypothetical protein
MIAGRKLVLLVGRTTCWQKDDLRQFESMAKDFRDDEMADVDRIKRTAEYADATVTHHGTWLRKAYAPKRGTSTVIPTRTVEQSIALRPGRDPAVVYYNRVHESSDGIQTPARAEAPCIYAAEAAIHVAIQPTFIRLGTR